MLLHKLEEDLQAKFREQETLIKESEALSQARLAFYGDKSPDEEEKWFEEAVEKADETWEQVLAVQERAARELSNMQVENGRLHDSTRQLSLYLTLAEQELAAGLATSGFLDEADYQATSMFGKELDRLTKEAELLSREQTELATRRRDNTLTWQAEHEKMVTSKLADELQEELTSCEAEQKERQQEIGAIRQRLQENESLLARQQERLQLLASQQKECQRWDALHQLIGSADGKKYRNFAQGLTFEMMVAHANRQLRKMTDRYLLVRDDAQPLKLNVIDNYQAGEIRSTKNLSGGESFIVSLALALGLSHMASRNVRVDSLFLDEGFGRIDDALETALETLAGLHQGGKLIGVISHVPALKERIRTQIQVVPQAGGRSSLIGPGCHCITAGATPMPAA